MNPGRDEDFPRILEEWEVRALLAAAEETRYPIRNKAIVLLACDAGLAAREIAHIKRHHVLTDRGVQGDYIDLNGMPGKYLKDRHIVVGFKSRLWWAIHDVLLNVPAVPADPLIISERALAGGGATKDPGAHRLTPMRATSIGYIFWKLMEKAGINAPTNSGRNTFLVKVGRKIRQEGASIRDMQEIAGYRSLETTRRFLEWDEKAQERVMRDLFDPAYQKTRSGRKVRQITKTRSAKQQTA